MKLILTEQEQDDIRACLEEAKELALAQRCYDAATQIVGALDVLDAHCRSCGEPHVWHGRDEADRVCPSCRYSPIGADPF